MGILSKISKFTGNLLNDTMGVSASARQQYQHQLALQKDAQDFSKWQMQNAHQTEVEDLKKAGLNPVLSAGAGGGASAGVSMGGASAGTGGADPTAMIANIINMSNSVKQTENAIKKTEADIKNETAKTKAEVAKQIAETRNITTRTPQMENDERLAKTWWGRNISPVLRDVFGGSGGGVASGAVAGAAISQAATSAKKAKTPKRNKIGF